LPAENGKLVFPPLKRNHTHSHQDPSERFLLIKNVREKKLGYRPPETVPLMKTVGRLRTQTLRENDGPIGIPIEDAPRQETLPVDFFFGKTPPLQCKVTQRLISVLKQDSDEIGQSNCVLISHLLLTKKHQKNPKTCSFPLFSHDAAASQS